MCNGRAKTAMGAEDIGVGRCREIATGSVGICGSRAKVSIGCVMLVGRRKFAYRYVMIGIGCSVDHCGLFLYKGGVHLHSAFMSQSESITFV